MNAKGEMMDDGCNWPTEEEIKEATSSLDQEKFNKIVDLLQDRLFEIFNDTMKNTEEKDAELTMQIWLESIYQCHVYSIRTLVHKDDHGVFFSRTISKLKDEMNDGMD